MHCIPTCELGVLMRFAVMLLFIMLSIGTARLRVDNGLNKNEGSTSSSIHDSLSEPKAPTGGCKNGLVSPDAPTTGAFDLSINEANGFAMICKKKIL
jgi:hypothetical protein